jgi:SAM-dependent methyltransferase
MTNKLLYLGAEETSYPASQDVDHLALYALFRSICRGKKILDVACGEGYGSELLRQWGADSVLGVDFSPDAIAAAKELFEANNLSYVVGEVGRLDASIAGSSSFDLICSFGTIGRVDDPDGFLRSLAALRSSTNVIAISAQNDSLFAPESGNSSQRRRYTFTSFKLAAEAALGPATQWYVGVPLGGYMLLPDATITPERSDKRQALRGEDVQKLLLLPPRTDLSLDGEQAPFWLGTWGEIPNGVSVAAPWPMKAFLEPWQTIDWLKGQMMAKNAEICRLENIIAEERRIALASRQRLGQLEARAAQQLAKLNRETIHDIAREVWFERQRWGFPYKIRKWLTRLLTSQR